MNLKQTLLRKPVRLVTAALLSYLAMTTPLMAEAAADHAAHSHEHAAKHVALTLNAGKKWTTDEPLRNAMARIRNALEPVLIDIHENRLTTSGYAVLAGKVNDEVAYMVSHCKLEANADAQLHVIIGELLEAAGIMGSAEGKASHTQRQNAAVKVVTALENYAIYFEDKDWKPLNH